MRDKTAIVTGGTRGIGLAIAKTLAEAGADLLITYKGNDEAAKKAKEQLGQYGNKVEILKSDVSSMEDAQKVADTAKREFDSIDILINNAGITRDKLLLRMSEEDFSDVVDTNLKGAFNMMKAVSAVMMKQKRGKIINISSIVGLRGNAGQVNYSASKAGLIGMTLSAAKELGSRNITVNAIAPGYIETDMTDELSDKQKKSMLDIISLKRLGKPEEVAKVIKFLASDDASYITGQVIGIDGGMSI